MEQTFGTQLLQFALSVDIVQQGVLKDMLQKTFQYLEANICVKHMGLNVAFPVNDRPGLKAEWYQRGIDWAKEIKKDGKYTGQISFAFDVGKPLWIVGEHGEELSQEESFLDLWSGCASSSLPRFVHTHREPIKTSIIVPLMESEQHSPIGVLDLESVDYMRPTPMVRDELERIAEAITYLWSLTELHQVQIERTRRAKDALANSQFPPLLAQPTIFFASASEADPEVVQIIKLASRESAKSLDGDPRVFHWDESRESGTIIQHLWREVSRSHLGIAYVSEPAGDGASGDYRFQDNPNVLFEAGMMEALKQGHFSPMGGWIFIREADSPECPFDLQKERIVRVLRSGDGKLDPEAFRAELERVVMTALRC